MNTPMAGSLSFPDITGTCPDVKPRGVLVRERYQDVTVKDFGDKWRVDYWDYTTTPRTKHGKKWSKQYVPSKRDAQKRADEFMEQVNERNNSPQLCSNDGDTFASLAKTLPYPFEKRFPTRRPTYRRRAGLDPNLELALIYGASVQKFNGKPMHAHSQPARRDW